MMNSSRLFGLGFGLLGLILFGMVFLQAQSRESFMVGLSVPPIQVLSVQSTKPFPVIGASDINSGSIKIENAISLLVSSNIPWRVVAILSRENLYVSRGKLKSIENVQWRIGSNPFREFSVGSIVIATGEGALKEYVVDIDYRLKLGWRDTPPGRWEFDPQFRIEPNY